MSPVRQAGRGEEDFSAECVIPIPRTRLGLTCTRQGMLQGEHPVKIFKNTSEYDILVANSTIRLSPTGLSTVMVLTFGM